MMVTNFNSYNDQLEYKTTATITTTIYKPSRNTLTVVMVTTTIIIMITIVMVMLITLFMVVPMFIEAQEGLELAPPPTQSAHCRFSGLPKIYLRAFKCFLFSSMLTPLLSPAPRFVLTTKFLE